MIEFFGLFATGLFLSGLIIQIVRVHKRKMADDLSVLTLSKWCIGLTIFLCVSLKTQAHWVFAVGYASQSVACFYLLGIVMHYQRDMKSRMKTIQKNVMGEVGKHLRVHDGGK